MDRTRPTTITAHACARYAQRILGRPECTELAVRNDERLRRRCERNLARHLTKARATGGNFESDGLVLICVADAVVTCLARRTPRPRPVTAERTDVIVVGGRVRRFPEAGTERTHSHRNRRSAS